MPAPKGNKHNKVGQKHSTFTLKKARRPFTDDLKERFLEHLAEIGLHYKAAAMVGVSGQAVYNARKADPEFDAAYEEAREAYYDKLEQEAARRAYEGVTEPVIGGKDRDEIVTYVRKYSDQMMMFLLRGGRPDKFRENVKVDASVNGGVMVVPGVQQSVDDWEKDHGEAAKGKALPEK